MIFCVLLQPNVSEGIVASTDTNTDTQVLVNASPRYSERERETENSVLDLIFIQDVAIPGLKYSQVKKK